MNRARARLSRRVDMADLLVGVAGDFVPAGAGAQPALPLAPVRVAAPPVTAAQ
jgi:hypothetical protein